jgi:hypothetical protein
MSSCLLQNAVVDIVKTTEEKAVSESPSKYKNKCLGRKEYSPRRENKQKY